MSATITVIDDDRNILTSVSLALEAAGYTISTYSDGESGLKALLNAPPDLAILDIKMPRLTGLEVLEKLRKTSSLPVIFLTSKDDETDEVQGLQTGADDYITKPFSQKLLLARIASLLRRQSLGHTLTHPKDPADILRRGKLTLDDARHLASWKGSPIALTVTEYLLLKTLAQRPGMVKNRDQLIDAAYGENIFIDDRTIDTHIKRVRKKFKTLDPDFNEIETLYGIGYRYREPTE